MSETSSFHEHFEVQSAGGESSRAERGLLRQDGNDDSSDSQRAAPVSENSKPPSIKPVLTPSNSWNEESERSASVPAKGKQSDETIEALVTLFRDFLEAAPNPATSNHTHTQQNTAGRKRFFGLNKGLSPETGSNNRYDYEQKYPRDRFGEEAADNARAWLTYLDEAESFDRERVEGWKETVDVLLVFAGLFSGVITTFVSQASQSLQQDNTQVSASLLFEIAQILRAQSIGTPINMIPNSTLTPTSRFIPSTNAFLVNGLWFTSLAITLSTALFAVLAKQWLYYYLSSIRGTANEKARARQLRFNGFELWGVGAIVDLLPILLHLAVGIFLTGIIILLFPLDIRVAWTIVTITGITYTLYFISVILPIRYPECPYTTSLTIYVGILFFFLQEALRWLSPILHKSFRAVRRTTFFQVVWRRIKFQALDSIQHYIHDLSGFFLDLFRRCIWHKSPRIRIQSPDPPEESLKFTNWREVKIKKAVENAAFLDFEALHWLYATSPNRSVHRIIARCVAVHPSIARRQFIRYDIYNLLETLEISQTNVVDLRYGLCLDVLNGDDENWRLLWSIPNVIENQLEEEECRSYSLISKNVIYHSYDRILEDVIDYDLKLPLIMWHYFLERKEGNEIMAAHILIDEHKDLFEWESGPNYETKRNAGVVSFRDINKEQGYQRWKFEYLFTFFFGDAEPDYSPNKAFETRYRLLVSVYRNLTSDQPLIDDKERRHKALSSLFKDFSFGRWLYYPSRYTPPKQFLAFFIDICYADVFWSESMTDNVRHAAVECLDRIWNSMDTDMAIRFPFTERHDLSLIYRWCSRDLDSSLSRYTPPMFTLLLVPQNRQHLSTFLSDDPDAVSHFSKCFQNLGNYHDILFAGEYIYPILMDLLKSVNPRMPLFTILYYNSSVLVQLWKLVVFSKLDAKKFFLCVKSKLGQEKLDDFYTAMTEEARYAAMAEEARYNAAMAEVNDLEVLNLRDMPYKNTAIPDALEASAHEFGQIIGVSHPRPMSTTEQSSVPEGAANRDLNIEERAQVSGPGEHKGIYSIANWIKKAFGSVWSKTRIRGAQFTSSAETELQDLSG